MANYYVRKSGNDTTGDGSTGNPWLTLAKALTTVSIAGGHTIYIGAGTYAENMSYTNSVYCSRAFTSPVTLRSESGNRADVIITGGATYTVFYEDGAKNVYWQDVTIQATGTPGQGTVRFQGACAAAGFENCLIYSHNANGSIYASNAKAVVVTLTDCTLVRRPDLSVDARGIYIRPSGGGSVTLTLTNCVVSGNNYVGAYFVCGDALSTFNVTLNGGSYTATGAFATGAYAILATGGTIHIDGITAERVETPVVVFGSDGATALETTGTLSNSTITGGTSHTLLIGYNATMTVEDCTIENGDYAVVLKMCDGSTLARCKIIGGTLAAVYFKGALASEVQNCLIVSTNPTYAAVLATIGEASQKCADIVLSNNKIACYGSGALLSWPDSSGDAGGGVCDYNLYRPAGVGKFGTVRGVANIRSLLDLRAAWAGYGDDSNDSHSRKVSRLELVRNEIR